MFSFHKNYKLCQHLNHQYDLNCVEIVSSWNEINQQDSRAFIIVFLFEHLKKYIQTAVLLNM